MAAGLADCLDDAFDRIEDFLAVQQPLSLQDHEPLMLLQAAAGIGHDERERLIERVPRISERQDVLGPLALGVLIGLFAAQLHEDPAHDAQI
jgi:hypothetical protein